MLGKIDNKSKDSLVNEATFPSLAGSALDKQENSNAVVAGEDAAVVTDPTCQHNQTEPTDIDSPQSLYDIDNNNFIIVQIFDGT